MDTAEIMRRLDAQDRVLHAILAMLAPPDSEGQGAGFEDLIETLVDLTEAVGDVAASVQSLRSAVCEGSLPGAS